jgi:hypothetical protein
VEAAQHDARRDRRSGREEGAPASDTWWTASPRSSTDGDLEKPLPSYHPEGVPEKKKQFVGHTVETFFHTATDRSRIGV